MPSLSTVFDGWNGYQSSIYHAAKPLTIEQLRWRPAPHVRSLGEILRHLSLGRMTWLSRIDPPGFVDIDPQIPRWYTDGDGARHAVEDAVPCDQANVLLKWLELSWRPIQRVLDEWPVEKLSETYLHRFRGIQYRVSNQWTLWRIMSHDLHHGGQVAMMLACQNISAPELRALGGHIISPPIASQV